MEITMHRKCVGSIVEKCVYVLEQCEKFKHVLTYLNRDARFSCTRMSSNVLEKRHT